MPRARNISPERKALLNQFIKEFNLTDTDSIQDAMKDLLGDTIQELLEAEMDEHLGYTKYDYKNRDENSDNIRNGHSQKTLVSSQGEITIDVPRDREGKFEAQIVRKNQKDILYKNCSEILADILFYSICCSKYHCSYFLITTLLRLL